MAFVAAVGPPERDKAFRESSTGAARQPATLGAFDVGGFGFFGFFWLFTFETRPVKVGEDGRDLDFVALEALILTLQTKNQQTFGDRLRSDALPVRIIAAGTIEHASDKT